jgi:hypothetical protein
MYETAGNCANLTNACKHALRLEHIASRDHGRYHFHTMTIQIDSDFVEWLIALYVIAGLCTGVIVVIWNVLKAVLKLVGWIFLRADGVKDLEELRIRNEARHAE